MNLHLQNHIKEKSWWVHVFFYLALALLVIAVFCYGVLLFKTYAYHKKIGELKIQIAAYSTPEEKAHEKKVFDYKKKIEDFAIILGNHKISSNVFHFIEDNTLPKVWFSDFNMSGSSNGIRLAGEAESMEILSRQFNILEENKDYVGNISVLSSQVAPSGKISFTLSIALDPKVFAYNTHDSQ